MTPQDSRLPLSVSPSLHFGFIGLSESAPSAPRDQCASCYRHYWDSGSCQRLIEPFVHAWFLLLNFSSSIVLVLKDCEGKGGKLTCKYITVKLNMV